MRGVMGARAQGCKEYWGARVCGHKGVRGVRV